MRKITNKDWAKFKQWQEKANRDQNNRRYRGSTQMNPDSIRGYHNKALPNLSPTDEIHHAAGLNRINPLIQTIKTKEQLAQFIDSAEANGLALGDSIENMFRLHIDLHDSADPRSIHRVEAELGLDDPLRYVPENATFADAIAALPLLARDVTESIERIEALQHARMTIGDDIEGFSDAVRNPPDKTKLASQQKYLARKRGQGRKTVNQLFSNKHRGLGRGLPLIDTVQDIIYFGNRLMDKPSVGNTIQTAAEFASQANPVLQGAMAIYDTFVDAPVQAATGNSLLDQIPNGTSEERKAKIKKVDKGLQKNNNGNGNGAGEAISHEITHMSKKLAELPHNPFVNRLLRRGLPIIGPWQP